MYLKIQTKTNCYLDANLQMIARVFAHDFRKKFNLATHSKLLVVFEKGTATWYGEQEGWNALTKECLQLVLENPILGQQCKDIFFEKAKQFLDFLTILKTTKLERYPNKEVWNKYHDYCQQYRKLCLYGEPLAHYVRETLTEEIKERIKCADEELNILLTPNYTSFIAREEIDLLRIALETKNNASLLQKRIKEHTQKYFWIPFDYGVTIWDETHFKREFDAIKSPEKQLKKIYDQIETIKNHQKQLEQILRIDKKTKELIEAQKIFAIIMDYKKEVFTQAHVVFRCFTKELMIRLNLSEQQAKMIPIKQIKQCLLENKQPEKGWLDKIINFSVANLNDNGRYEYLIDEQAEKVYDQIIKENEIEKNIKLLQGYIACKGYCKGKVRVITDAKMINKLKQGEILVCHMTSPDFVIGMKKAGAIITEEGGITSHAAIISRELDIPCVIRVKNATEILKTGDRVDVDANKGIIRLLK